MIFGCDCVGFLLGCIKKIKYIVIFSLKRIWRRQWNSVESDSIADTFFCFMFNQGFRYVSSCVSCERLASTADIGWEVYLLYLRNIIICVFVGYLKYFVKSCISSRIVAVAMRRYFGSIILFLWFLFFVKLWIAWQAWMCHWLINNMVRLDLVSRIQWVIYIFILLVHLLIIIQCWKCVYLHWKYGLMLCSRRWKNGTSGTSTGIQYFFWYIRHLDLFYGNHDMSGLIRLVVMRQYEYINSLLVLALPLFAWHGTVSACRFDLKTPFHIGM